MRSHNIPLITVVPLSLFLPIDINDLWNQFKNWISPPRDPLAIYLDADGIETIAANGTIVFDHDGDGVKTGTGWVASDDGLLVRDINGNGQIDDGVFDAEDAKFANVQIWQDADQDGSSDAGELSSLTEAGIVNIDLNAEANNVNLGNGNVQTATAAHLTADGETGTTIDTAYIWFSVNLTQTVDRNTVELSDTLLALPEAVAFGNVKSLRQTTKKVTPPFIQEL